jgi:hypothetical protein
MIVRTPNHEPSLLDRIQDDWLTRTDNSTMLSSTTTADD